MKRYAALDVGDKTVGIAVSDELNLTAQGVTTVLRRDEATDFADIAKILDEYAIRDIVIGLPKNMNGTEGERCAVVREFAEKLLTEIPSAKVFFQDERLSTVAAERTLKEAGQRRKKRKKVVDKMAAVIILQAYLDRLRNREEINF